MAAAVHTLKCTYYSCYYHDDARCHQWLALSQMYLATDDQLLSKQRQQYVLDNAKAKLRAGNFDGGIEGAIVDIGLALSGADLPGDTDSSQHWDWGLGVFGAIFGGVLCNSCW